MALAACCVALLALAGASAAASAAASGPVLPTSDPFYSFSGSLAGVAPGTILRQRQIGLVDFNVTMPFRSTQVLYRTTGELGQPTATVATIIQPLVSTSSKIVSYQMAYDALGPQCDPSYTLQGGMPAGGTTNTAEEQLVAGLVVAGFTVVVPDYEGTALDWAAGQEEGYNTLDGIRATENLLKLPSSTLVGMVGYSGGSIATEFASELASSYGPALDIVGVAEGGIPVDFEHNLSYINGSPSWSSVIPAVLVSLARAFHVDMKPYLSAYGLQLTNKVQSECIANFIGNWPGLTYQKLLKPAFQNIYSIPAFVRISNELIMGRGGTPREPVLMGVGNADGTGDGVMVYKDVEALAHGYCQRGVPVELNVYAGDEHTQAAVAFLPAATLFLTERLNGLPATNGCSSIPAGNALTPVPAAPQLVFRSGGYRAKLHGVVVWLRTTTGTMTGITIKLTRGRVRASRTLSRLTTKRRRLVLRVAHAGRYTLSVSWNGVPQLTRRVRIRKL
ncbi:MAG TPA: lipase family protein [Solirubrobacteraceae bacterium]|nr:lipase family protein [Solirubrobacteraceae bacterium]